MQTLAETKLFKLGCSEESTINRTFRFIWQNLPAKTGNGLKGTRTAI